MKTTAIYLIVILILGSRGLSLAESATGKDRAYRLAKAAADWLVHDDWGKTTPTNRIANAEIAKIRESLERTQTPLTIALRAGTNDWMFFSYDNEARTLTERTIAQDTWPTTQVEIWHSVTKGTYLLLNRKDGDQILTLRLGGSLLLQLKIDEREDGVTVLEATGPGYVD